MKYCALQRAMNREGTEMDVLASRERVRVEVGLQRWMERPALGGGEPPLQTPSE